MDETVHSCPTDTKTAKLIHAVRWLVQDERLPFFTTAHFDGHPLVLIRASRLGELAVRELAEVVQDAWLSRASSARGGLAARATDRMDELG